MKEEKELARKIGEAKKSIKGWEGQLKLLTEFQHDLDDLAKFKKNHTEALNQARVFRELVAISELNAPLDKSIYEMADQLSGKAEELGKKVNNQKKINYKTVVKLEKLKINPRNPKESITDYKIALAHMNRQLADLESKRDELNRKNMTGRGRALGFVRGGLITFGLDQIVQSTFEAAKNYEETLLALIELEGNEEKAQKVMDWIDETATQIPASETELRYSYMRLREELGIDSRNGTLMTLSDTSIGKGVSLPTMTDTYIDVKKGKIESLVNIGVTPDEAKSQQNGLINSDKAGNILLEAWEKQYHGASKQANKARINLNNKRVHYQTVPEFAMWRPHLERSDYKIDSGVAGNLPDYATQARNVFMEYGGHVTISKIDDALNFAAEKSQKWIDRTLKTAQMGIHVIEVALNGELARSLSIPRVGKTENVKPLGNVLQEASAKGYAQDAIRTFDGNDPRFDILKQPLTSDSVIRIELDGPLKGDLVRQGDGMNFEVVNTGVNGTGLD